MFCNESCHILEFECNRDNFLVFAVKLPELLAYVNIEEETQTRLQQKLLDFLKYAFKPFTLCKSHLEIFPFSQFWFQQG